jgi:Na+/proline symporter
VQRYTSVKTPKDAKKVGWMFGALYVISPVLWMLPPMIYRVYNPGLIGMESEGAYLLMCKIALPVGMLGMMLGGMVFATASSLNATLNISSGVFTNDIYKRLNPGKTDKQMIKVARISTILFGVLAVVVAMLIPAMGGIVNVVISLGALTGVPLYLPIIWTLFSKRQTSKSVVTVTLASLLVNVIFKFITPLLFSFSLNRTQETILGVSLPVLLLLAFELYFIYKRKVDPKYAAYIEYKEQQVLLQVTDENQNVTETKNNSYSLRVIGYAIAASGLVIASIGVLAATGKYIILPIAALLIGLGIIIVKRNRKK